jgi:hypothetical protein
MEQKELVLSSLNANKTGTRELQLRVYTRFGWDIMERQVRTIIIDE